MSEQKKWITPTDEMKKRFVYHILIYEQNYAVYDIQEAYHSLGTANGSDYEDHYFIYYNNEWVPYYSKSVHRICWDIRYKQKNTTKCKWDEWQLRKGGYCEMYANGKLIYAFKSYSLEFALAKAQYLTVALTEFPGYNFLNPEEEKGRKVWWYGLPATIQPKLQSYPWEISIHPDYTEVEPGKWWAMYRAKTKKYKNTDTESEEEEISDMEEEKEYGSINWGDAFETGGRIDWFRN